MSFITEWSVTPNGTATQTATIAFTPDTTAFWDIVNITACKGRFKIKRCSMKLFDKYKITYNTEPLNAPIKNRLPFPTF